MVKITYGDIMIQLGFLHGVKVLIDFDEDIENIKHMCDQIVRDFMV